MEEFIAGALYRKPGLDPIYMYHSMEGEDGLFIIEGSLARPLKTMLISKDDMADLELVK